MPDQNQNEKRQLESSGKSTKSEAKNPGNIVMFEVEFELKV